MTIEFDIARMCLYKTNHNLIQHSEFADFRIEAQRLKVRVQIIMQAWAAL